MVATPCLSTYTVPILEARPAEHSDAREAETSTGTVPSIGVKGLTRLQDYTLLRLSLPMLSERVYLPFALDRKMPNAGIE